MKKIFISFLLFLFSLSLFANYERALDLYKRSIDYLNMGKSEIAVSTYYKAIKEDHKILALKDFGLSQMLLSRIRKNSPTIEGATVFMLYGYSDEAREFINKSLSTLSPGSNEYSLGQNLLKKIKQINSKESANDNTKKPEKKLVLDNTKKDKMKQKNATLEQSRTILKRKITGLSLEIKDLKTKIEEQKKITDKSQKEHKMWFGLNYGGYANDSGESTTYYNLEQFYNEQFGNEQKKLDALNQQLQQLNSQMDSFNSQMNSLNSEIEENSKKELNISN